MADSTGFAIDRLAKADTTRLAQTGTDPTGHGRRDITEPDLARPDSTRQTIPDKTVSGMARFDTADMTLQDRT